MADIPTNSSPTNGEQKQASGLPRIRTYAADISRVIKQRGETLSSIVSAEKNRTAKSEAAEENARRRSTLFVAGAVLLVLVGIGIVTGAVIWFKNVSKPPAPVSQGIIFPNRTLTVSDAPNITEALTNLRTSTDLMLGEVARITIAENGVELSPQEIARQLGLPDTFAREVTDIMVGIHAFDRNQPFVIARVNAFDRSFNALLSEEPSLGKDLGTFFAPTNATTPPPNTLTFTDGVIRNLDVRQSSTMWPILYAFPERTLVVITTNEFTLREIMSRLGRISP